MQAIPLSSLVKIRSEQDLACPISQASVLRGERHSFQIAVQCEAAVMVRVKIESALPVKLYAVRNVPCDYPAFPDRHDDDFLTLEPCLMPDLLEPMEKTQDLRLLGPGISVFWADVRIPEGADAGSYTVTFMCNDAQTGETLCEAGYTLKVLPETLPKAELLFTQWFHVDCIADVHRVPIYSEAHWQLIESYIALAADLGINLILTPVITPPLDTAVGTHRPNTQLVKIEKSGDRYRFDFTLLTRWIGLCRKYGIEHFEISHLFSQWGAGFAPNIFVTQEGEERHLFGWHVKADDPLYQDFLKQFLPALLQFLKASGVADHCYFHISDEPHEDQLDAYRWAKDFVSELLPGCRFMDALSHYGFYEQGLVPNPVCATNAIEPFLEHEVESLWAYYCCGQNVGVGNRYLAMPSYRNRILGLQLYRYRIKGFLHWGYNYYNARTSAYRINPYVTTSGDFAYPSGDAFSVYPGEDGAYPSLRAVIFAECLQDIRILRALEAKIGRDAVEKMIDEAAGGKLTFAEYPRCDAFIPELMERVKARIAEKR